jgi:flagellar motor switch protein FliG
VAAILNALPPDEAQATLAGIEAQDPDLAREVRALLFTFEDLERLDDRSLREILREAPAPDLLPALKAATPELRDRLLAVLPTRAAALMREDLDALPPVRLSEALAAQARVCALARRLEAEGRAVLSSPDERRP